MAQNNTLSYLNNTLFREHLRGHHLFAALSNEEFSQLMQKCRYITIDQGTQLFTQKDIVQCFYFLKQGKMKLYRTARDGGEKVIEIIMPEQFFAEALALMPQKTCYPLIAEAITDCHLVSFDTTTFLSILMQSNATCIAVMQDMVRRLHHLLNEIDNLTLHNATYRLINFLLQQVNQHNQNLQLSISKQVIASRLSIKPETLSRILSQLSKAGLIIVERKTIQLKDIPALQNYLLEH